MEQLLTAEMLLREIYQAETELRWFEQKYGLLSETFYRLYEQGQLRDENSAEIREYLEWSGWWEIYQSRRQRYEQAITQRFRAITAPASLVDLHVSQLSISGSGCGPSGRPKTIKSTACDSINCRPVNNSVCCSLANWRGAYDWAP